MVDFFSVEINQKMALRHKTGLEVGTIIEITKLGVVLTLNESDNHVLNFHDYNAGRISPSMSNLEDIPLYFCFFDKSVEQTYTYTHL